MFIGRLFLRGEFCRLPLRLCIAGDSAVPRTAWVLHHPFEMVLRASVWGHPGPGPCPSAELRPWVKRPSRPQARPHHCPMFEAQRPPWAPGNGTASYPGPADAHPQTSHRGPQSGCCGLEVTSTVTVSLSPCRPGGPEECEDGLLFGQTAWAGFGWGGRAVEVWG